ncbi:hypothetical protein [Flavobacterium sp.]|uniref:hypothetical protein n=1 Tax=Flavobacterium sp. TaxID=239 RepID=UPI004034C97F
MKIVKALAIGCGGFILLSVIILIVWFRFINSTMDQMEEAANDKLTETIRLEELPLLKGTITSNKIYTAPFSGDSAALCVLKVGVRVTHYGRVRGGNRKRRPKWAFDHVNTVIPNPSAIIKIGNDVYPVDFKDAIFKGIAVENDHRYDDATFATNSHPDYYDILRETTDIESEVRKPGPVEKKQFLKNIKMLKSLYGLNRHIDKYIDSALKQKPIYDPVNIEEIIYRNGDSIKLKGKIENGRIVPLF